VFSGGAIIVRYSIQGTRHSSPSCLQLNCDALHDNMADKNVGERSTLRVLNVSLQPALDSDW
jgi:hypothetical protein